MKKSYAARTRFAARLGLLWAACSAVILICGILAARHGLLPDHVYLAFTSFTCGMLGAGLGIFTSKRKVLRSPETLRKNEVQEHDERNQLLAKMSAQGAFWGFLFLNYLASFVVLFWNPQLYFFLCVQILVLLALYLLVYAYCRRKV